LAFTLKQLDYFARTAELGSTVAAARALNISQPSISSALAQLERTVGVDLFVRQPAKGLALTPTGRRLLQEAKRLLAEAESLDRYASDLVTELKGVIEVGCMVTLAPLIMPSVIADFASRHPAARINCHELDHREMIAGLQNGRFDFVVSYDLTLSDRFAFDPLATFEPYIMVAATHPAARRSSVSLRDFAEEPMILLDLPHSGEYFQELFRRFGLKPNILYQSPSPHMVRSMVANGLGYSVANAPWRNDRAMDGRLLRRLPIHDAAAPLHLGILTLQGQRLPATAEALRAALKQAVATVESQAPKRAGRGA
jgi:DNA-binding transcriptional LysR family regulator